MSVLIPAKKFHSSDFVIAFDATSSMSFDVDKSLNGLFELLDLYYLKAREREYHLGKERMRVKFVFFRDFIPGITPIEETSFLSYPSEKEELRNIFDKVDFRGGGDIEECGLEALWLSMNSNFQKCEGVKDRQVFIVVTDADALALGERCLSPNYPSELADIRFDDLETRWNSSLKEEDHSLAEGRKRRLILFTPERGHYLTLSERLYNSYLTPFLDFSHGYADYESLATLILAGTSFPV